LAKKETIKPRFYTGAAVAIGVDPLCRVKSDVLRWRCRVNWVIYRIDLGRNKSLSASVQKMGVSKTLGISVIGKAWRRTSSQLKNLQRYCFAVEGLGANCVSRWEDF
jgi:hypothetical protein